MDQTSSNGVLDDITRSAEYMVTIDPLAFDNMDCVTLAKFVDFFNGVWCPVNHNVTISDVYRRNELLFGSHIDAKKRYNSFSALSMAMSRRLELIKSDSDVDEKLRGALGDSRECDIAVLSEMLSHSTANIQFGYESVIQAFRQLFHQLPDARAALPQLPPDDYYQMHDDDVAEMKPAQRLIRYYLNQCGQMCLRRLNGVLYSPRFTQDMKYTRTYEIYSEIQQFIYSGIFPYNHHRAQFADLTSGASVPNMVKTYLENCHDALLPELKSVRYKFAFPDGLFDAKENKFYPYESDPPKWNSDITCANYINTPGAIPDDVTDPMDISTPNYQRVMDAQKLPREVCRWFYASMGRMVFDVGELDDWQYLFYCKGVAGSGKSTILRRVSEFYHPKDVGIMMSEGQENFSVEHLYDKNMFFCYDVGVRINFSPERLKSIITGEPVTAERKHKTPVTGNWTAQGAFAGNRFPPWLDDSGSFSRRFLIFLFDHAVLESDQDLANRCKEELGVFLRKCVWCYHWVREQVGNRGIWDKGVLPDYFHESQRQYRANANPILSFLISESLEINPNHHMSFSAFSCAYKDFITSNRLKHMPLTNDSCNAMFSSMGLSMHVVPNGADPSDHCGYLSGKYIRGASLR